MKRIAYIVLYFGRLDNIFPFWLKSVEKNTDIDFLLFTDDKSCFDYPDNVIVSYLTFNEIRQKIQKNYDFEISLDVPYKICDYRPAYGEIFSDELAGYDFWGYCDVDLIFGNIRRFITDDILDGYERIGFQGHSTLFKNSENVNLRYRYNDYYKNVFTLKENLRFDELGIDKIYNELDIEYYHKTNFAHISPLKYNFYLRHLPQDEEYKNKNQIFKWENGILKRIYICNIDSKEQILEEEFMYLHIFRRSLKIFVNDINNKELFIYPNVLTDEKIVVNEKWLKKHTKNRQVKWYFERLKRNRKKLSPQKILYYIKLIFTKK